MRNYSIMHTKIPMPAALLLGVAVGLLSGCGSTQPAKFYRFTTPAAGGPGTEDTTAGRLLVVGPVAIPPHLDRAQIAIATDGAEIKYDEYNRWAEPLNAGLGRAVLSYLDAELPSDTVIPFAWLGTTPYDYRVILQILTFEGQPGKEARLVVQWSIMRHQEKEPLAIKTSYFTTQPNGDGYDALVRAHSRLLGLLSAEIADVIRPLPKTN